MWVKQLPSGSSWALYAARVMAVIGTPPRGGALFPATMYGVGVPFPFTITAFPAMQYVWKSARLPGWGAPTPVSASYVMLARAQILKPMANMD